MRYRLVATLRDFKRLTLELAAVALAVCVVSSTFIALDSSALGILRSELEGVNVDFVAQKNIVGLEDINESRIQEAAAAFSAVKNIEAVGSFASISNWRVLSAKGENGSADFIYSPMILPFASERKIMKAYNIIGEVPQEGTVALSVETAKLLGVSTGDLVSCSAQYPKRVIVNGTESIVVGYVNLSFPVSETWTQNIGDTGISYDEYRGLVTNNDPEEIRIESMANPVVLNRSSASLVVDYLIQAGNDSSVSTYFVTPEVFCLMWLDRSSVLDLGSLARTLDRITYLEDRLSWTGVPLDFSIEPCRLSAPLEKSRDTLEGTKPLFLALSLPVVAVGAYFCTLTVDIQTRKRRMEIAILKSRGARDSQVLRILLFESLVVGSVAGLMSIAIGVGVSRFLLGQTATLSGTLQSSSALTDISIMPSTVLVSITLGAVLATVSAYRPLKRASATSIRDALRHQTSGESEVGYKARWDLLLLAVSSLTVLGVLLSTRSVSSSSYILSSLYTALVGFAIFVVPILPVLLSVSIVRLVTLGSKRTLIQVARLARPIAGSLHGVVVRVIMSSRRRVSNVSLIASLAIALGVFISITIASSVESEIELARYDVPTDVVVSGTYLSGAVPAGFNYSIVQSMADVRGVMDICNYQLIPTLERRYGNLEPSMVFDSMAYMSMVQSDARWPGDVPADLVRQLSEGRNALASVDFSERQNVEVGDTVILDTSFFNVSSQEWNPLEIQVKVTGIVKELPGLYGSLYMDSTNLNASKYERLSMSFDFGSLANVDDGYEDVTIASELASQYSIAGLTTDTLRIQRLQIASMRSGAVFGVSEAFWNVEYALTLLLMSAGVGVIFYASVDDRIRDLASIMARGASKKQIGRMIFGEATPIVLLGIGLGTSVGLLVGFLFNELIGGVQSASVPRHMVLSESTFTLIGLSAIFLISAILVSAMQARRVRIIEILRNRMD